MSDMLHKLYILMDEEINNQLRDREDLAALMKRRAGLEEVRRCGRAEGELARVLTEAAEILDGELDELRNLELFRAALTLGLELGRLTA